MKTLDSIGRDKASEIDGKSRQSRKTRLPPAYISGKSGLG